jgi:hypothetical protein
MSCSTTGQTTTCTASPRPATVTGTESAGRGPIPPGAITGNNQRRGAAPGRYSLERVPTVLERAENGCSGTRR